MYGAELASVDFQQAFEDARKTINEWVKGQTEGEVGRTESLNKGPSPPPLTSCLRWSPPSPPLSPSWPQPWAGIMPCSVPTAFRCRNSSEGKLAYDSAEAAKYFFPHKFPKLHFKIKANIECRLKVIKILGENTAWLKLFNTHLKETSWFLWINICKLLGSKIFFAKSGMAGGTESVRWRVWFRAVWPVRECSRAYRTPVFQQGIVCGHACSQGASVSVEQLLGLCLCGKIFLVTEASACRIWRSDLFTSY